MIASERSHDNWHTVQTEAENSVMIHSYVFQTVMIQIQNTCTRQKVSVPRNFSFYVLRKRITSCVFGMTWGWVNIDRVFICAEDAFVSEFEDSVKRFNIKCFSFQTSQNTCNSIPTFKHKLTSVNTNNPVLIQSVWRPRSSRWFFHAQSKCKAARWNKELFYTFIILMIILENKHWTEATMPVGSRGQSFRRISWDKIKKNQTSQIGYGV